MWSKIWAYLKKHPTKVTGASLAVAGSIQAASAVIQPLISPLWYALFTVAVGGWVSFLGFLNTVAKEVEESPPEGL